MEVRMLCVNLNYMYCIRHTIWFISILYAFI